MDNLRSRSYSTRKIKHHYAFLRSSGISWIYFELPNEEVEQIIRKGKKEGTLNL